MRVCLRFLMVAWLVLLFYPVFAQEDLWEQKGLKVKVVLKDKKTMYQVEDENKRQLTIFTTQEIKTADIEKLVQYKNLFFSFKIIQIDNLTFNFTDRVLYMTLIPSEIRYQNKDLTEYLPSGINFIIIDGTLMYFFPVLKDKKLIKVKGIWTKEEEFLQNVFDLSEIKQLSPQVVQKDQKEEQLLTEIIKEEKKKEAEESQEFPMKTKMAEREKSSLLGQKNAQREFLVNQEKNKLVFSKKIRLTIGSGSLFSAAFPALQYRKFEMQPSLGIVYDTKKALNESKTQLVDQGILACPIGLKLYFHFLASESFGMYAFGGGLYSLGVSNYENRTLLMAGLGQVLYEFIFVEAGWMYNKNANGLIIGFGVQWKL